MSASKATETEQVKTLQLLHSAREERTLKLNSLEEHCDLVQSELASAQSDLATANSQSNTHLLTIDKAG